MVFNILNELICKWMGKACHFLIKERGGSFMNNHSLEGNVISLSHYSSRRKMLYFQNYKQCYATSRTI